MPPHCDFTPNHKYCVISLFSNEEDEAYSLRVTQTVPHPTIYRVKNFVGANTLPTEENYEGYILGIIKDHIKKNGTIKEIRLTGHGLHGWMGSQEGLTGLLSIKSLLVKISQLEKDTKIKVTDRIVFDACETFSSLHDDEIEFYAGYAKNHAIEIVGTTSKTETIKICNAYMNVGRYVQFSPDGSIKWDKLDTPFRNHIFMIKDDKSWIDFYVGHSADEVLSRKKAQETQLQQDAVIFKNSFKNMKSK